MVDTLLLERGIYGLLILHPTARYCPRGLWISRGTFSTKSSSYPPDRTVRILIDLGTIGSEVDSPGGAPRKKPRLPGFITC